ncbi:LuxR C-terminal-related transcriptional regulator [Desulfosporosinus meridiei]|uniref:ATP-dependent transcriptional regulator n=1 Tax=Desulfosporosinus meridiei (strain ATCC BAA-275 / DSM 13257 / KCTC 12902 / NCIMB 13706 / S10) TaxID=768704 RepID=J7IP34_DESMD|nr:LuxR C-terminal-related transcriptional regulator [Desulfosporosinus meridiei]AFQ43350.1 ATP-dependent transcriptional regulator [Desulfosporosinus meridiei DSM 13257]
MANLLLKTKIHVPKPRPGLIGRKRLLERLDEGLLTGRPFALISAPAGYGKTTLVTNWLAGLDRAKAWLSLDELDNDPVRFFSYLIASLQTIDLKIGQETTRLLSGSGLLPVSAVAVTLLNEILAASQPFVLVLDDFQEIKNETIFQAVQTLLDHHPYGLHLVMITREDPALSLPRLRVRNQLTEIRLNDLRFDLAESMDFFTASAGVKLKDEEVAALEARTEGWIAGLQLAALSLRGLAAEQAGQFIKGFSGHHRYIIDFLMEEVIKRIDPRIQNFLTRTAVVDRFNAELGDVLTGESNAKTIIAQLEQANLFLIPLDSEGRWYRYHHLFAQFLRTELRKSEQICLQQQAAHWFADNGLGEEGIKYALAAGSYDLAGDLLRSQAAQVFQRGEMVTLLEWLNLLPAERVETNQEFVGYKAWSLFLLGKSEEAVHYLQRTEGIKQEDSDPLTAGRLLALRGWIANYREDPRTKEIALSAIEKLAGSDPFFLEIALLSLGHAQRKSDPMPESTATLYRAYDTARRAGHMFTGLGALLDITMNLVIQGERRESMKLCKLGLQEYADSQGKPLPMAELLYIPLGILQYEGNNLEEARDLLEQGIRASRRLGLNRILGGDAEQTLALIYWTLGEIQTAWDLLEEAKANTDAQAFPIIWDRYKAFEAHLLLKQGDLTGATSWLESSGLSSSDSITSFKEILYLVLARILFRIGRLEQALELLNNLRQFDLARGRKGRLVYVNVLSSVVLQAWGRQAEAISLMKEAADFAASEGYIRPFLGEGSEVRELLLAVQVAKPEFITPLLGYFSDQPKHSDPKPISSLPASVMIEALTQRELEVLRLVAEGLSNEEIATQLYISLGTVKWHVKNIFGKLGVGSRTQAAAQARRWGILR